MDNTNTATATRFYDSHGGLWETCSAIHDDAEAFGPSGIARLVHEVSPNDYYASAAFQGRTSETEDVWIVLDAR